MAAQAPATTPVEPAVPHIKVFVGNLSFKTRDGELNQAFSSAGAVQRAKVIRDVNRRSLGYGFVEFKTLEDAKKAVESMNKKEIDGRQINVELAKPRDENAPRPPRPAQQQNANNSTGANNNNATSAPRGGRGGARGGSRGGRGGRRVSQNGGRPANNNNNATNNGQPQEDRKPSKTTLFVSNLPFSMDEAGFTKLFSDKGFKPVKSTVVKRQNGRSKGYGFAEFDTEENQQKALNAVNGITLEERVLVVRVALTELSGDNAQQQGQTAQPAANTTATTTTTNTTTPAQSAPAKTENKASGKQEATTPAQPAPAKTETKTTSPAPAAAAGKTDSPSQKKQTPKKQ